MYYPHSIEEVCYTKEHINNIITEIEKIFPTYFNKYIETDDGNSIDDENIKKLAATFGNISKPKKRKVNIGETFNRIIQESIDNFERDRKKYLDILNIKAMEEFEDDPSHFKNTILKNQCPIIHHTIQNKQAKELDKYRTAFKLADPGDLLTVVNNLTEFAIDYKSNNYNSKSFESIDNLDDLKFSDLQDEDYIVFGVIGGGIKSHLLYKLYPQIFPNRSREAIWALWYLTSKKKFDCKEDSEFLMIDLKNNITQQNYFYPYDLFSFYSIKIYNMLKKEALNNSIKLSSTNRFVIVDSFLSYITNTHMDEINLLKQRITEDGYGY